MRDIWLLVVNEPSDWNFLSYNVNIIQSTILLITEVHNTMVVQNVTLQVRNILQMDNCEVLQFRRLKVNKRSRCEHVNGISSDFRCIFGNIISRTYQHCLLAVLHVVDISLDVMALAN